MASTDAAAAAAIAAATTTAAAAPESVLTKVQKYIDTLKTKNAKLLEDNTKLRAALAEARSSHSRIRRIPKGSAAAAAVTST